MKTQSEVLLNSLAQKTMLSLWARPNVFRPSSNRAVPAKEVTDVLAIFGDDVFCFSDKDILLNKEVPIEVSWQRWYKAAVTESAKQLLGAKRYLSTSNPVLYEDQSCKVPLRIALPALENRRIHLICVARGANQACRERVGGSGFLMQSNQYFDPSDIQPFILFQPTHGTFIHVLDSQGVSFLLHHLDTAADLKNYLIAREEFFNQPLSFFFPGEHELFCSYAVGSESRGEPKKFPPILQQTGEGNIFWQREGTWGDFERSRKYRLWQSENEKSMSWDELIEHFIMDLQQGHFEIVGASFSEMEKIIRMFAATTRLERRQFTDLIRSMVSDNRINSNYIRRVFAASTEQNNGFLFVCMNPADENNLKAYYERLHSFSRICSLVIKHRFPEIMTIVSLSFASASSGLTTFQPFLFDLSSCTEDEKSIGREFADMGFFSSDHASLHMSEFERNPALSEPSFVPFEFPK